MLTCNKPGGDTPTRPSPPLRKELGGFFIAADFTHDSNHGIVLCPGINYL